MYCSHVLYRGFGGGVMFTLSCCCWIAGDATVAGGRRYETYLSSGVFSRSVCDYRGVDSRISDDGTNGFNDEVMHYSRNVRSLIRYMEAHLRRILIEGDAQYLTPLQLPSALLIYSSMDSSLHGWFFPKCSLASGSLVLDFRSSAVALRIAEAPTPWPDQPPKKNDFNSVISNLTLSALGDEASFWGHHPSTIISVVMNVVRYSATTWINWDHRRSNVNYKASQEKKRKSNASSTEV